MTMTGESFEPVPGTATGSPFPAARTGGIDDARSPVGGLEIGRAHV